MPDNIPIILEAKADTRQFERDIAIATQRAGRNIKPLPLGKIQFSEFNKSLDAATARVIAFTATTSIVNGLVSAFVSLVKETVVVQKTMTDLNTVLSTNTKTLTSFRDSLFDISRQTAQSFKNVSAAALEFSRQGLGITETLKRTKDAMILARISGLDVADAVDTLTASMNGFSKAANDTTKIVNTLATVDANFAVSTADLAEALKRVGSTADDANVSFNELVAGITAVQQTTSRGGAVIGNAFKSIFTRISRADTISQLREMGVAIDETQSGVEKLKAIADRVKQVDATTANFIKELAGGVYQINLVSASLNDLGREYSIYGNALKVANSSTNEAIKRNEALNQTLSALGTESLTNIQSLLAKIGDIGIADNLKSLLSNFNSITKSLGDSLDGEGIGATIGKGLVQGLGNFITGPGAALLLGIVFKLAKQVTKDIGQSLSQTLGITTETAKQAQLQGQISQILSDNIGKYGRYLKTAEGVAVVEAKILETLIAQANVSAKINSSSAQIAKNISPKFVSDKKGGLTPTAAHGIFPAYVKESNDIKRGVGGANGSDKPVYIPKFNYGTNVGPVMANSGEKIVENFLGGKGSAILNRDMIKALGGEEKLSSYGKVSNVSEGFVPSLLKNKFLQGSEFIGQGIFGEVFKNDAVSKQVGQELVFKSFKPGNESEHVRPLEEEFAITKVAEQLGLPVAKIFGSLSRSKQRGGLFKELVKGFTGDDFVKNLEQGQRGAFRKAFRSSLEQIFRNKGIEPTDLHGNNYKIDDNLQEVLEVYRTQGASAAAARMLPKTKVYDTGLFEPLTAEATKLFASSLSSKAEGFVPEGALKSALGREVEGLMALGLSKEEAIRACRIGASPILKNSKNPQGLGVYNTAQGQTSLEDAFRDHRGENLKKVGTASNGVVPNLALSPDDELRLQAQSIKFGGLENAIKKGLDISNIDFTASETTIRRKLSKLIEESFDIDFKSYGSAGKKFKSNLLQEVKSVRAAEIEEQQTVTNQQRDKLRKARENEEFAQQHLRRENPSQAQDLENRRQANLAGNKIGDYEGVNATSFNAGEGRRRAAAKRNANLQKILDQQALYDDLLDEAKSKINQRGAFSLKTGGGIFGGLDISRLSESSKSSLLSEIKKESKSQRLRSFEAKSLQLSLGASFVSPFTSQAAEVARSKGNTGTAGALDTLGAAGQGAAFGAILGPYGAAAGAAAGAIYGLVDALDQTDEVATKTAKAYEDLVAKNNDLVNSFGSYIQTQQKLNTLIESGGRKSDIEAVTKELSQLFSTISDDGVKRSIISSFGDPKKLGDALSQVQTKAISQQRSAEAVSVAATERDRITSLGVQTGNFSGGALNNIARSLSSNVDSSKLAEFSTQIEKLGNNLNETDFVTTFQNFGFAKDQIESIFASLKDGATQLGFLKEFKKELDLQNELSETVKQATRARTTIADLNKTIGSIVNIRTTERKTALGIESNAFSRTLNAQQGAVSNRNFNASESLQADIAAAFEQRKVEFNAKQDSESATLDIQAQLASFLSENRVTFEANKGISEDLNNFIKTGIGDLKTLSNEALQLGSGSGEQSKVFSDLANLLAEGNGKLVSINDNARTQIGILRDTNRTQKERIAIQNRAGLLGGAEGQINFGKEGFDKFRNRDVFSQIGQRGGQSGLSARSQEAQGILEVQKAFGKLENFDVRNIIPNAQKIVQDSIKENLVQGFARIGLPLDNRNLKEIDKISQLSAANEFETRQLSEQQKADLIGASVASSFQYDKFEAPSLAALNRSEIATNTATFPKLYDTLVGKLGLQKEAVGIESKISTLEKDKVSKGVEKSQLLDENKQALLKGAKFQNGVYSTPLFSQNALKEAVKLNSGNLVPYNQDQVGRNLNDTELQNAQLLRVIGKATTPEEIRKAIDESLNAGLGPLKFSGDKFVTNALRAEGFVKEGTGVQAGVSKISDEGFAKILERLGQAGALKASSGAQQTIDSNLKKIGDLDIAITGLNTSIKSLESQLSSTKNKENLVGTPEKRSRDELRSTFGESKATLPTSQSLTEIAGKAISNATSNVSKSLSELSQSIVGISKVLEAQAIKINELKFGDSSNEINKFGIAQKNQALAPSFKTDKEFRSAQSDLLKIAQSQKVNGGEVDSNITKALGNVDISKTLSRNNAQDSFQGFVDEANDTFVSGFATDSDLKKIANKISNGLDDYVRAQVTLGVDEKTARKDAENLREQFQKQLTNIDVSLKIPKSNLGEFADGFKSSLQDLQKEFDDLNKIGSRTAEGLVDGFGDAFFDIVSGAKSAEDAVRGMLSSIAADLAKFYAKKAFATIFSAAAGNSNAGGYQALNQGGLVRYSSGGRSGKSPALVMGGEHYFSPDTVNAFGVGFFKDLNSGRAPKYALGGMTDGPISGGSGNKDDIFTQLDNGGFVLRKSAVNKYGKNYLNSVSEAAAYNKGGKVQRAFWGALIGQVLGGALQGAVVGGATAKLSGGDWKKGALYGAIGGGVAGGVGGYGYAKSNPNAGFGGGFGNSFSWTGLGKNQQQGNGAPLTQDSGYEFSMDFDGKSLAQANGGYASGVGNNSLTTDQTQAKPSIYKQVGTQLAVGGGLTLLASALAPKAPQEGSNVIPGHGSITTYNSDGSVAINTASGTKIVRPGVDFNSTAELENLIRVNGGELPQKYASGGAIRGVGYNRPKSIPNIANRYITQGSGIKDDVYIKAKKGEFVLTEKASSLYNRNGFVDRLNRQEIDPQMLDRGMGVMAMNNGGTVGYEGRTDGGIMTVQPSQTGSKNSGAPQYNIEINVTIGGDGNGATVTTKSSGNQEKGQVEDQNSISGQRFANKIKTMFMEFVEQEKRPGGSLSKDNM